MSRRYRLVDVEEAIAESEDLADVADDIAETDIPPKVEHIISIDSNMLKNFLPFIREPPFTNYSYILPY